MLPENEEPFLLEEIMNCKEVFEASKSSCFGASRREGVYFLCKRKMGKSKYGKEKILYIGSSKNIQKRVLGQNHHYLVEFRKCNDEDLVYVKTLDCKNRIVTEKKLIKFFKPKLNVYGKR